MKRYITIIALVLLFISINSCKKETNTQFSSPGWKEDTTGKYPVSMTAVVALPRTLQSSLRPDDKMGAFIKEECRGVGVIVKVDSASSVFYLLIHGAASEQDKIKFKYYSTVTSYMYATAEFLNFSMDGNYGTADKPEILDLQPMK